MKNTFSVMLYLPSEYKNKLQLLSLVYKKTTAALLRDLVTDWLTKNESILQVGEQEILDKIKGELQKSANEWPVMTGKIMEELSHGKLMVEAGAVAADSKN